MDEKGSKEFLAASGYRTTRKRILCSCNWREFLQLIESKVKVLNEETRETNERELIDGFVKEYNEEIVDVKFKLLNS